MAFLKKQTLDLPTTHKEVLKVVNNLTAAETRLKELQKKYEKYKALKHALKHQKIEVADVELSSDDSSDTSHDEFDWDNDGAEPSSDDDEVQEEWNQDDAEQPDEAQSESGDDQPDEEAAQEQQDDDE